VRVEDADGNVVWDNDAQVRQVLDPAVAYLVNNLLSDAVNKGTGTAVRRAGYSGPAAGKTGTTSGGADTWFVGYTPDVVGTVWIGFDEPKSILRDATGGRLAAPVWGRIMRRVTANRAPSHQWIAPKQIREAAVDPGTGLLLEPGCRPERGHAVRELFIAGTEPGFVCPRGTPAGGPPLLAKLVAWSEAQLKHARTWFASRFEDEKPVRQRKARERYLQAPQLPSLPDAPPETSSGDEAPVPDIRPEDAQTPDAEAVTQPDQGPPGKWQAEAPE
jgi:penicillin-binding protein 1A